MVSGSTPKWSKEGEVRDRGRERLAVATGASVDPMVSLAGSFRAVPVQGRQAVPSHFLASLHLWPVTGAGCSGGERGTAWGEVAIFGRG